MKINHTDRINAIKAYNIQRQASSGKAKAREIEPSGEKMEISPKARELQYYLQKLRELPEIREELVRRFQEQIKNNCYQPKSQDIAQKILESLGQGKDLKNEGK